MDNNGFNNLGGDKRFSWLQKGVFNWDEDTLLRKLKTTATLDASKWVELGKFYLLNNRMDDAEIAFLGARYCDYANRDLLRYWLGVFSFNRSRDGEEEKQALALANRINEGIVVVVNDPVRQINELQHLLILLDNEAMKKV